MIVNFIAPGGAGKSAIINELLKFDDVAFGKPVSYTSRPARTGEVDGIDYHFRSKKEILNMYDKIAVHETSEGIVYANSISTLKNAGKTLLTTLRPGGVCELERILSDILVIHLLVDEETRVERMLSRGDNRIDVETRVLRDKTESTQIDHAKIKSPQVHIDCSKPLADIMREIVQIIDAHRN